MARSIAIIGGGAAGTLTAIHFARASRETVQATIIEPRSALPGISRANHGCHRALNNAAPRIDSQHA